MAEQCKEIDAALAKLEARLNADNKCCKEVKAALARLEGRLNADNKRIAALEGRVRRLENAGNKQGEEKSQDLAPIYKRLAKAEQDILDLGGIIQLVIDDIKEILDSLGEHNQNISESQNIFSSILNFFIDE